jgi:hypothetical protein
LVGIRLAFLEEGHEFFGLVLAEKGKHADYPVPGMILSNDNIDCSMMYLPTLCARSRRGDRVMPTRVQGVAPANPSQGQPAAFQGAVFFHRFPGVMGAGGREATLVADEGGQRQLV